MEALTRQVAASHTARHKGRPSNLGLLQASTENSPTHSRTAALLFLLRSSICSSSKMPANHPRYLTVDSGDHPKGLQME